MEYSFNIFFFQIQVITKFCNLFLVRLDVQYFQAFVHCFNFPIVFFKYKLYNGHK